MSENTSTPFCPVCKQRRALCDRNAACNGGDLETRLMRLLVIELQNAGHDFDATAVKRKVANAKAARFASDTPLASIFVWVDGGNLRTTGTAPAGQRCWQI